jgi:hypothetical protein
MAADALEAEARRRFVRWDPRLWRQIVEGPAQALAGAPREAYLRLCCEAVGLGYLFPAAAGREGFFNLAFLELAPLLLPALAPARQVELLALLWNLGENLESAAPWLGRIFVRVCGGLASLDGLEAVVADVERQALGPPTEPLGVDEERVDLAGEDRRFLPGPLHFVAPTVVCVHDRLRAGVSLGVWLAAPPLVLGPMGCGADVAAAGGDGDAFAAAANEWRRATALVTSQRVVVRAG